jgi:hypothetical protein
MGNGVLAARVETTTATHLFQLLRKMGESLCIVTEGMGAMCSKYAKAWV